MNFKEWLSLDYLVEAFGQEEIDSHKVLDGKWEPPLNQIASEHDFYFNSEPDPQKECNGHQCYKLHISCNYHGGEGDVANISFRHTHSGYGDRFKYGASTEEKVLQEKIGKDVMKSILNGLGQYIRQWKPSKLSWGAISKSAYDAKNTDARRKVYKLWATRNLFPKHYVPVDDQTWIRKDLYDTHLVKRGFPTVPDELKSPHQKGKIADEIIDHAKNHYSDLGDAESEFSSEMAERSRRQREEMDRADADRLNTRGLKVGDQVLAGRSDAKIPGEIIRIYMYSGVLLIDVRLEESGQVEHFNYDDVEKATEEAIANARQREEEFISRNNPEGLKVGDPILYVDIGNTNEPYMKCTLIRFTRGDPDYDTGLRSLTIVMRTEDGYEYTERISNIRKDTPENREKAVFAIEFKKVKRELKGLQNAEHTIHRNIEWHRVNGGDQELSDTSANPNRLKHGDVVKATTYGKVIQYIVVDFEMQRTTSGGEFLFVRLFDPVGRSGSTMKKATDLQPIGSLDTRLAETKRRYEILKERLGEQWLIDLRLNNVEDE